MRLILIVLGDHLSVTGTATMSSAMSYLLVHETSAAITSLNGVTLSLTTWVD